LQIEKTWVKKLKEDKIIRYQLMGEIGRGVIKG